MIHKYWNPVFTTFSAHCWAVHHLMLLVLRGNWCLKVCWLKEPLYCKRFSVFIWQPQASMGPFSSLCVADVYNDNENNLILVSIKLRILEFLILLGEQKDLSMSTKRTWCVCVCAAFQVYLRSPAMASCSSERGLFMRPWPGEMKPCGVTGGSASLGPLLPLSVARKEKKKKNNNGRQPKGLSSGCVLQGCFPSTCWCSAANKCHYGEGCEIPFFFLKKTIVKSTFE